MGGPALINGKALKVTDNFHVCKFRVNEIDYPSAEHFYQCMKCVKKKDHDFVLRAPDARDSWRRGNLKRIKMRKDWFSVRVEIMYDGNLAKFQQNRKFRDSLISTKGKIKVRGSCDFWNKWNAIILTRIREELREENDRDNELLQKMIQKMDLIKQNDGYEYSPKRKIRKKR